MRIIFLVLFLGLLVGCGKNDGFYSPTQYPYSNYTPTTSYPPGAPGYQPNFNVPQGYNTSFYYFSALYNYYAYRNQIYYWNQIWQNWTTYANYSGYNQYNFGAFWNQYAPYSNVIDVTTYDWFDINIYSYYGY